MNHFFISGNEIIQKEPGYCKIAELEKYISNKEKQLIKINTIEKSDLIDLINNLIDSGQQKILIVDEVSLWENDLEYDEKRFISSIPGNYIHIKNVRKN